jgi:hypothetical protein
MLQVLVTGKSYQQELLCLKDDCSRELKQTAFLLIITTGKKHRWIGRLLKTDSTSIFLLDNERSFSSKREHIDF